MRGLQAAAVAVGGAAARCLCGPGEQPSTAASLLAVATGAAAHWVTFEFGWLFRPLHSWVPAYATMGAPKICRVGHGGSCVPKFPPKRA